MNEVMRLSSILSLGKKHVEEVELPFYNTKLKVRPLSRYESSQCVLEAAALIQDKTTREQFILPPQKRDKDANVNKDEMNSASLRMYALVVYKSVKDLYAEVTFEEVEKLFHLEDIASHILSMSARKREEIDFFRGNKGRAPAKGVGVTIKSKISR